MVATEPRSGVVISGKENGSRQYLEPFLGGGKACWAAGLETGQKPAAER